MTWVTAIIAPLTVVYQAWTYWVFRQRISAERIPAVDRPGEACVLTASATLSAAGRPAGPATVAGIDRVAPLPGRRGGLRSGDLRLRDRLGDRAGEASSRASSPIPRRATLRAWLGSLSILLALWVVRTVTHWLQARLGQRGASAVIADLNGQVLAAVTARQPTELAAQRDAAAVVVTRGLDGLRPYFTGYLPTLLLAAILTPATVAVIALYDLKSTVIVVITLPLIPIFMVLIGLATAERSAAALAAMTTLQARLLDLIAGIPTLRALGRAAGPEHRIAELAAAHRRSAMATLRIAFLSALVLELLATLGVALIAVGIGLRLVFGEMTLTTGLTVLLLAPDVYWPLRRIGVEFHAAQDGRTAADKAFALIGEPAAPAARNQTVAARGAQIRLDSLSVAGPRRPLARRPDRGDRTRSGDGADRTQRRRQEHHAAGDRRAHRAVIRPGHRRPGSTSPSWTAPRGGGSCPGCRNARCWCPGTVRDNLNLLGELDDLERPVPHPDSTRCWPSCPTGWTPCSGAGASACRWVSDNGWAWPGRSARRPRCCCSTSPPRTWTPRTEERVLRAIVERARAGATVVVVGHREPVARDR